MSNKYWVFAKSLNVEINVEFEHPAALDDLADKFAKAVDGSHKSGESQVFDRACQMLPNDGHGECASAYKSKLLLDSIDTWLLTQPTLVNVRKRSLIPIVLQRQTLADGLARYLTQLGLERRHKVKTISDLLNGKDDTTPAAETRQ